MLHKTTLIRFLAILHLWWYSPKHITPTNREKGEKKEMILTRDKVKMRTADAVLEGNLGTLILLSKKINNHCTSMFYNLKRIKPFTHEFIFSIWCLTMRSNKLQIIENWLHLIIRYLLWTSTYSSVSSTISSCKCSWTQDA